MYRITLLFAFSFYSFMCSAQLVPVIHNGLWGFCDSSMKLVIPVEYNIATPFKYGIAKVGVFGFESFQNNGVSGEEYDQYMVRTVRSGLIDSTGKEIIACNFDDIKWNNNYIILVNRKSKWKSSTGNREAQLSYNQYSDSIIIVNRKSGELHYETSAFAVLLNENSYAILKPGKKQNGEIYLYRDEILIKKLKGNLISPIDINTSLILNGSTFKYIDLSGNILFKSNDYKVAGNFIDGNYLMANDSSITLLNSEFKITRKWKKYISEEKDLIDLLSLFKQHTETIKKNPQQFIISYNELSLTFNTITQVFEVKKPFFSVEEGRIMYEYGILSEKDSLHFLKLDNIGNYPNYCRSIYADFLDDYLERYQDGFTFICHYGYEDEGYVSYYKDLKSKSYIIK